MKPQRDNRRFKITRRMAAIAVGIAVVIGSLVMLSLALPVQTWRTGRAPVKPLAYSVSGPEIGPTDRIWIDTDAACGAGPRIDPDDCFAIVLLLKTRGAHIAGISTVFGNASLAVTDATTKDLISRMGLEQSHAVKIYAGAAAPLDDSTATSVTPARGALRAALAKGPLTIISLGPLTNIAAALEQSPQLQANVKALVTVMGRRPGHIFHPAEGEKHGKGANLLGHGPVFRDFNFAKDDVAAARVVSMHLPLVLVPYDAGVNLAISDADLANLSRAGAVSKLLAASAADWLNFWKNDVGQSGFYPFDLAAAAYVLHPTSFDCATVHARVMRDDSVWTSWFYRPKALLVSPAKQAQIEAPNGTMARYCPNARDGLKQTLLAELAARQD